MAQQNILSPGIIPESLLAEEYLRCLLCLLLRSLSRLRLRLRSLRDFLDLLDPESDRSESEEVSRGIPSSLYLLENGMSYFK